MARPFSPFLSWLALSSLVTACGYVGLEERGDTPEPILGLTQTEDDASDNVSKSSPTDEVRSDNLSEVPGQEGEQLQAGEEGLVLTEEPVDIEIPVIEEPVEEKKPDLFLISSDEEFEAQLLEPEWFDIGFEALESDAGVYTSFGSTLALSEDESISGDTALKASQGGEYSEARFIHKIPRVRSSSLYFRAWVFIPEGATTGKMKLVGFRSFAYDGIDVNLNADMKFDVFHHDTFERNWSSDVFEEGKWSCLQVDLEADRYDGSYRVHLDEELILEVEGTDTQPGPIDYVEFGLLWSEDEQEKGVVYWDEVATSDSPIACEYDE